MTWDVALPKDSDELPVYLESEQKIVFEHRERGGDTLYICCENDRCGGWDIIKETYSDIAAEEWFNKVLNETKI